MGEVEERDEPADADPVSVLAQNVDQLQADRIAERAERAPRSGPIEEDRKTRDAISRRVEALAKS